MRIKADELVKKAALLIGETPSWNVDPEECVGATLADYLRLEIELRATEAVLATPRERLTGWKSLDASGIITKEDGSALLPLPEDFLLLHTLRLSGWERSVTEVHLADSAMAHLQSCRWEALRATPQRPVAVLEPGDNAMCLHLYGTHSDPAAVEEGWYMPAPRIDSEGYISIPEASVPTLLNIASRLTFKTGC